MKTNVDWCINSKFMQIDSVRMLFLYLDLLVWFSALPSFVQNSIFQANNQFETYEQLQQQKSPEEEEEERGSGR